MATIRNIAGEARMIPLAGRVVEDGEEFEVDDDVFDNYSFHPDLFKVVDPPSKPSKTTKTASSGPKE
jgi:hypothetical protein